MPGITMNSIRPRQVSSSSSVDTRYGVGLQGVGPGAKALVEGYSSSMSSANGEHPRYDLVRFQSVLIALKVLMVFR